VTGASRPSSLGTSSSRSGGPATEGEDVEPGVRVSRSTGDAGLLRRSTIVSGLVEGADGADTTCTGLTCNAAGRGCCVDTNLYAQ